MANRWRVVVPSHDVGLWIRVGHVSSHWGTRYKKPRTPRCLPLAAWRLPVGAHEGRWRSAPPGPRVAGTASDFPLRNWIQSACMPPPWKYTYPPIVSRPPMMTYKRHHPGLNLHPLPAGPTWGWEILVGWGWGRPLGGGASAHPYPNLHSGDGAPAFPKTPTSDVPTGGPRAGYPDIHSPLPLPTRQGRSQNRLDRPALTGSTPQPAEDSASET
jgi:hypothetical protein